jgi:hypothetical protein
VVEELWDVLQLQSASDGERSTESSKEETFMKISYCATAGTAARKMIRLPASINDKQILVLVDSGGSGSFISAQAVDELKLKQTPMDKVMWWWRTGQN